MITVTAQGTTARFLSLKADWKLRSVTRYTHRSRHLRDRLLSLNCSGNSKLSKLGPEIGWLNIIVKETQDTFARYADGCHTTGVFI